MVGTVSPELGISRAHSASRLRPHDDCVDNARRRSTDADTMEAARPAKGAEALPKLPKPSPPYAKENAHPVHYNERTMHSHGGFTRLEQSIWVDLTDKALWTLSILGGAAGGIVGGLALASTAGAGIGVTLVTCGVFGPIAALTAGYVYSNALSPWISLHNAQAYYYGFSEHLDVYYEDRWRRVKTAFVEGAALGAIGGVILGVGAAAVVGSLGAPVGAVALAAVGGVVAGIILGAATDSWIAYVSL